ncbi:MAG: GDP-mannose 4,6-dehydratase [Nitrososphaerales archaeon]
MVQEGPKRALITGITGQDGSYLAELLLHKGYEVHAIVRRASTFNTYRIDHIYQDPHENPPLKLYYGDLSDSSQISNMIRTILPDEIYHLGAQSHVRVSFDLPEYTGDVTAVGTTRILEAIRQSNFPTKLYQASSSEMFGAAPAPQNEETPFRPQSPYACSKLYAYWMVRNYRDGYSMWCSNGILFNHESPRRGPTFVTRKIASGVAAIASHKANSLFLGSLESKRDWGYAPEYVETMWKMMQKEKPDDYVLGTGESHTVGEFVEEAFSYAGLESDSFVKVDKRYFRPNEVYDLSADCGKARRHLNWDPQIRFLDLAKIMVDSEFRVHGLKAPGEGDAILEKKFPNMWWNDHATNARMFQGV